MEVHCSHISIDHICWIENGSINSLQSDEELSEEQEMYYRDRNTWDFNKAHNIYNTQTLRNILQSHKTLMMVSVQISHTKSDGHS